MLPLLSHEANAAREAERRDMIMGEAQTETSQRKRVVHASVVHISPHSLVLLRILTGSNKPKWLPVWNPWPYDRQSWPTQQQQSTPAVLYA